MNRRNFLGALLAGAILDPERLLWRPGAKLISIPRPPALAFTKEEFWSALNFYYGDQWPAEVRAHREAAGRPSLTWNRIAPLVDTIADRRKLDKLGPEWKKVLVETVREHRDRQMLVNFLLSHEVEGRIPSPLQAALISDQYGFEAWPASHPSLESVADGLATAPEVAAALESYGHLKTEVFYGISPCRGLFNPSIDVYSLWFGQRYSPTAQRATALPTELKSRQ
jgi:hypothetical protein